MTPDYVLEVENVWGGRYIHSHTFGYKDRDGARRLARWLVGMPAVKLVRIVWQGVGGDVLETVPQAAAHTRAWL